MAFIDTNIILRYIAQDSPAQAARARALVDQLMTGDIGLVMTEGVLIEAVQVLSSKVLYNLPRDRIRANLTDFIMLKGVKLRYKGMYARALDVYATRLALDFVDALLVAHMERTKDTTVYSFDRDFDRVEGITRQEP